MRPTRRCERIEDGSLPPVTVEAQVGHGQVGLTIGLRGEAHKAVQERAVWRIVRHVRGELGTGRNINADGDLAGSRNSHTRTLAGPGGCTGIGDGDPLTTPVGGAAGEEAAVHDLGQGLGAQLVGRLHAGEVVEGDVEVPARRAIPQVGLGPRGLRRTHHGRIHGRGRSSQSVHEARALRARGVQGTRGLGRVGQGTRGSHDEVLDDVGFLTRAHRGEQRVGLDALQDDGADARHLRGRHRGARRLLVRTVRYSGENVATGRRDLGLQAQVGGDAPRGELRGLVGRGLGQDLALGDGQVVVGGLKHGLPVGLGDERGGHILSRQVHDDERADRDVVVDEDARRVQVVEVLDLLLEGHLAARDEHDLTGQPVRELLLQVGNILLGGEASVHVLVGPGGQVGEVGDLLAVHAARTLVANIHAGGREGVTDERVLDGADGHDRGVGGGLVHHGGVGVGGVGQALAGVVAVSGREGIACGSVDGDPLLLELLVHGVVDRVGLVVHAGRPPQRQVDDVGAQDDHVVEGCQEGRVQQGVVLAARHLADDDLRVRGGANDLVGVAGGDAGDVRPMESGAALARGGIRVVIRVVVGEGELLVVVDTGLAHAQLGGQGLDIVLGQAGSTR